MEASRSEPVEYPINLAQQLHDPVRERKHTAPTHGTTRLWIRAAPQNTTHWLCSSFAQQFLPPSKYHKKKLLGSPDRAWHTTVGRVGCAAVEFEKCFTNKKKKRSVGAGCNKTKKNCVDKSRAEGGGTAAASSSSFTIMKKEQGERGASRPLHDERDTADSNDGRTDGRRADPAKKRTNQVRGAGTSYPPSLFARKRRFGLDARTAMAALFFLSPSSPFFSSVVLFFLFLHQLFSFYLHTAPPIFFLSAGLN